ncbi:MAG: hypothetical protein DRJ96_05110 [Thermoprotei archaeon]|nr:MAG: hypothetical protein DRJ96_05110 [Thermoprotei archaeon]
MNLDSGGISLIHVPSPWEWRDNYLRTVEFREPEWVIGKIYISMDAWHKYREEMEEVVLRHRLVFSFYRRGMVDFDDFGLRRRGNAFIDPWGCKWMFLQNGLQGQVVEHPLENWAAWRSYSLPDPDEGIPQEGAPTVSWEAVEEAVERAREAGGLVEVGMGHGFFFQRLYYLRGFRNLMRDFILKPPEIYELVEALTRFYEELARRVARLKPDIVVFGDDLGMQDRMPISPRTFREFIYPAYRRVFGLLRSRGIHVYLHTDGHVVEVLDQLVETGVSVLNVQDRVNGVNNLRRLLKGRVCIDLDVDRQRLLPRGSPREIREYIRRVILELGSRRGGLMFTAGIYSDTPPENVDALASALEDYARLHRELD